MWTSSFRQAPVKWVMGRLTDSEHLWFELRRDVVLSALFALVSGAILFAIFFCVNLDDPVVAHRAKIAAALLWAIWTLVPPLYFMCEWASYEGSLDDPKFEAMKYSHELCAKFWVAGVTVLSAALLIGLHLK